MQAHGLFALALVSGRRVVCAVVLHGLYVQHGCVRAGSFAEVYLGFMGLLVVVIAVVVEFPGWGVDW